MADTLTDKWVVTRKPHQCIGCFRNFQPEERMRYWVGIYEGDFGSCYTCKTCHTCIAHLEPDAWGGGYEAGFVSDRLEKGQTPEQFLEELEAKKAELLEAQDLQTSTH